MPKALKTVLFIVEGPSEITALERIFKKLYKDNREVKFQFTHGDLTSDEEITKDNIVDHINAVVKDYLDKSKLKRSDIYQIIQVIDTDGTFVPDCAIHYGDTGKFLYTTTSITSKYPEKIRERNQQKESLMNYLQTLTDIKGISYETYYMSSNLDHALYNVQNVTEEEKEDLALEFYEIFREKPKLFIEFLKTDVVNGVPDCYESSWRFIKEGLHSLERHTNLQIYFSKHPIL